MDIEYMKQKEELIELRKLITKHGNEMNKLRELLNIEIKVLKKYRGSYEVACNLCGFDEHGKVVDTWKKMYKARKEADKLWENSETDIDKPSI